MADSIADRFIMAMAAIKDLERHTGNDEPMRHQVRMLKMNAEQVLDNAIRSAWAIAETASQLPKESKEAAAEAVAKVLATPTAETEGAGQ